MQGQNETPAPVPERDAHTPGYRQRNRHTYDTLQGTVDR
jgi:hypothetical protein